MLPVIDAAGDRTMSWAALSRAGLLSKIAGAPCVRATVHSGTVPADALDQPMSFWPSTWVYSTETEPPRHLPSGLFLTF